jgi:hypothetical protein
MKVQRLPTLAQIQALQAAGALLPQIELKTEHFWADGLYARMLFRPADTLIVGKVHLREHLYVVLSGEVTITGDGYKEHVIGPKVFVSQPGTKRAVYAHTDATTMTVHRTDERDLDKIEAELIEPDEGAMYDSANLLKHDKNQVLT